MRYIKLDLLTLLISLFVLGSCQNPDSIGLDVNPQDRINGTLINTTVTTTTVKEDSLLASDLSQQPLGNLKDPVFGTTQSDLAMALSLPTDSSKVTFGISPVLDSAVLVLKYGSEFYGDSVNSKFTVDVHQLAEPYASGNSMYFSNKNWRYNQGVIGSKTVNRFAVKDSIRIINIVKGKADTAIKVPGQLRIPISSSFINSTFFNGGADNFASSSKFANYIKGLYLTINKEQSTGAGGIVFFVPDSGSLQLYYKRQLSSGTDTSVLNFKITNSASSIKHDYTGTPVQEQLNNPDRPYSSVFVQALGGLRTRLRFPNIDSLKQLGRIAINKAELVVYVDPAAGTQFAPAPRLMLYRTDIAGQRQELPDNDVGQVTGAADPHALDIVSFGGVYDPINKRYVFNMSTYVQDILNGRLQQYDTYLAPVKYDLARTAASTSQSPDPRRTDIFPSGTTAVQSALGSATNSNYKIKLNIIYTRLGQ